MNRWARLCIYVLTATAIICGTVMLYLRGVMPDTNGWSISHESGGGNFTRTEKGIITEDYLNQYIMVVTARQYLDIYIDEALILSSRNYGYNTPVEAKFTVLVTGELIGREMRIVFTTPYPGDNLLMGDALSFQRINAGMPALDYSITAISIVFGIAALILAFAFGIRNPGSLGICLFALMNFALAFSTLWGDTLIGYEALQPRLLHIVSNIAFFTYMLPLLFFFYITLTGAWKKCALILIVSTGSYAVAALILNAAGIIPFGLTDGGYNYILSLSITLLIFMLALQPKEKNSFSTIARFHLALWTAWGLSAAVRLLIFDLTIQVNVEYRIMYSLTLMSLTFFGIYAYAGRIKDLQERERIMSVKTGSLMTNYEQVNAHIHEVNSLKHDMKHHLTALHVLLKDNRYDEARSYLEKYVYEVGEVTEAFYHQNYLINAMVYDLVRRAKAIGVKTELSLKASPVYISEPDIVSLFSNIIDNALEACAKIAGEREGFIRLSITKREPYLAIICKNSNPGGILISVDDNEENKIHTSKAIKGHGYGLQTIERIAASYGGMTEVVFDDESFTITVALKDK